MFYLFVSYIYTQFKIWGKVFGFQILFTGSKLLLVMNEKQFLGTSTGTGTSI